MPVVLWWGRFDPGYSRNRILRKLFSDLGWTVRDFHPLATGSGDWEARLRRLPVPDLVWVPCFRQRDLAAASRWAGRHDIPLVFDPLISAYDKQVDERGKLASGSRQAKRLLAHERTLFQRADYVIADTVAHADYYEQVMDVLKERIKLVYVGAEEQLFNPAPLTVSARPVEILFYGSFIPLQGADIIIEAARNYVGPPVQWTLLGQGPLRKQCEADAENLTNVCFEDRVPYEELPARIQRAHILLGIFGTTPKAGRVIPNKVFQSLACGRPVVTRCSAAYPAPLAASDDKGLVWVKAGDPGALAEQVRQLVSAPENLSVLGAVAADTSRQYFSAAILRQQLSGVLESLSSPAKCDGPAG